jgi:hypothetical protein
VNFYGSTTYVASVIPGQPYSFWVHGLQGNNYGNAASASFTCGQPTPFNYTLSNSGDITVNQGGSGSTTVTLALLAGSSQGVTLSASGLPAGASASFTNNGCNPTCTSTLTITTSASTPAQSYPITVSGAPLNKTTGFNLVVNASSNAPTWPAGPVNLTAQCSADNLHATLSWGNVNGASSYALRVNDMANDGAACIDGWYCGEPQDKIVNFYGSTTYVASVIPGQPYSFWVHGLQGEAYGDASAATFTCGSELAQQ